MDLVSVRDLSVSAVIGVHDWEREITQTLVFSVDMAADVRKAARRDDLADALDYSAVARQLGRPRAELGEPHVQRAGRVSGCPLVVFAHLQQERPGGQVRRHHFRHSHGLVHLGLLG